MCSWYILDASRFANRVRWGEPGSHKDMCGGRYVKRAMHGTRLLSWSELRETYGRELVNLRNEGRYGFLNTLFSVSEAVMYMQVNSSATFQCCTHLPVNVHLNDCVIDSRPDHENLYAKLSK